MPPRRKRAALMDAEDSSEGGTEPDTSADEEEVKADGKRARRTARTKKAAGKAGSDGDDDDDDTVVMWQWKSGGRWVSYAPADSTTLEKAYAKGDMAIELALSFAKDTKYEFDLKANKQVNPGTGKVRLDWWLHRWEK